MSVRGIAASILGPAQIATALECHNVVLAEGTICGPVFAFSALNLCLANLEYLPADELLGGHATIREMLLIGCLEA